MHVYMLELRWGNRSGNFVYKMQNEIILRGAGVYYLHKSWHNVLGLYRSTDDVLEGPKHYNLHRMICHHS